MAILEDDEEEDEGETEEAHVKKKSQRKRRSRVFLVKFRDAVEYLFEMMQTNRKQDLFESSILHWKLFE